MKFFRTFLSAAIVTLAATAAFAEKPATRSFERDGVNYEYTTTEVDGKTILRGTADGHLPFKLVVTGSRVRGTVDGKFVSFRNPNAPKAEATVLARAD
jgi:hypothetical protein